MYELVLANVSRHIELTVEARNYFISILKPKTFRKRRYFLQAGDICRYECFVNKGCQDQRQESLRILIANKFAGMRIKYSQKKIKGQIATLVGMFFHRNILPPGFVLALFGSYL
jgi:hypothetical protein